MVYIGQEGRLPEGTTVTQGKHPPFYYLVASELSRVVRRLNFSSDFTFLRVNPDVGVTPDALAPNFFIHTTLEAWPWHGGPLAMHLARYLSVLAGLLLVLATYGLGRGLWPARPEIALAGAAFVAFLPESLFVGVSVSNDMLAARAVGPRVVAGSGGPRETRCVGDRHRARPGISDEGQRHRGLAHRGRGRTAVAMDGVHGSRSAISGDSCLLAAVATAIAAPWLYRNWTLYGDPLGTPVVLGTIDRRQAPLDLAWLARGWFLSFWGKFGGAGHIPLPWPLYALWGVLAAGAVAGGAQRVSLGRGTEAAEHPERVNGPTSLTKSHQSKDAGRPGATLHPSTAVGERPPTSAQDAVHNGHRVGWLVLAGAPLLVILSMLSYSQIALGTDQGRLLFPVLAPLGLLIAAGLAAWLPANRRWWLAPLLGGVMFVAAVLALIFGILRPFAPPLADPAQVAAASPVGQPVADGLELVAATWGVETGAARDLTLYWQPVGPVTADLRVILRLYGEGDAVAVGMETLAGRGPLQYGPLAPRER